MIPPDWLTFEGYQAIEADNWSSVKHIKKSPTEYVYRKAHPTRATPAMILGHAAHVAILEPERFASDEFVIAPDMSKNSNDWKAWKAKQTGRTILDADHHAMCCAMRDAVRSHPAAGPYLAMRGESEKTITWIDPVTGLKCKARLDWWIPDANILVDIKTTNTIDAFKFGRTAKSLGHPEQLAFYHDGIEVLTGRAPRVLMLAVEQAAPHDAAVFSVEEDQLGIARRKVIGALERLKECRRTNTWPGRYPEELPLDMPIYSDDEQITPTDTDDEVEIP